MKSAGIICECNPPHAGHLYLIDRARSAGADAVVCLMSGFFTQRGDAAVMRPAARAEALLKCGADAVLELPFPFCSSGAEFFGRAGVEILSRLPVDELWFGSECGDLSKLSLLAETAASSVFAERYAAANASGVGSAKAYFDLLSELSGVDASCASNDILAVSYLRALRSEAPAIRPVTVRRTGSGYRESDLPEDGFPSATALRRVIAEKGTGAALPYLSPVVADLLRREAETGRAPADLENASRAILAAFRTLPRDALSRVAGLSGGLSDRMADASREADSLSSFLSLAGNRKYPDARLRRGILFALCGVEKADLQAQPAYVRLLGANERGREFLSSVRRSAAIPVVTKNADIPDDPAARRQHELEERVAAFYALCTPSSLSAKDFLRPVPVIL